MQKINIDQVKNLPGSTANLFDIKTISEPIIQKGWSCISDAQPKRLNKSDVPTVYEFLKNKLNNADGAMQTQIINNGFAPNFELNGYYYYANGLNIYKSNNADLSNPTLVATVDASQAYGGSAGRSQFLLKINLDNKHIFVFGAIGLNDNERSYICTFNDNWEQLYLKNYNGYYTNYVQRFEEIPVYNNKGYIHLFGLDSFILISIDENGVITDVIEKGGNDEFPDGMTNVANFYTDRLGDIFTRSVVYDNKLYWCTSCMVFYYDFLTNEYHNFNPALPTGCIPWGYNYRELGGTMFIYNGFLTIVNTGDDQGNQLDKLFMYQLINGSWILVNTINGNTNDFRIKSYFFDGTYHYFGLSNTDLGLRYFKTIDFTNINVQTITNQYNDSVYAIIIANNDYIFITEYNGYCLLTLVLTPYTDTINGVDIKYYKSGDWKICTPDIAVGNDTNLQTVYEYLGYLNYWWIDTTEEKITLQRNSNLWTMMYVGDDYDYEVEHPDTLPSGNATRLLPQVNIIEDTTSTSITFSSSNSVRVNASYKFNELSSLSFGTNSIISSPLGTTIKFESGSTATIFTDTSGIDWTDGKPEPSANKTCLIFIWDNTGFYKEW